MENRKLMKKISQAEVFAQLLSKIPPEEESFVMAVTNAYADGLVAGQMLERQRRESEQIKALIRDC